MVRSNHHKKEILISYIMQVWNAKKVSDNQKTIAWELFMLGILGKLFIIFSVGHTGAYHRLVRKRPAGSLVAPSNVFSVGMHIVIVVGFQAGAYLLLLYQPW